MCTPANLAAQGNPFESVNGVNYSGLNMYIGRRNVEGGNRIATFITNSAREVLGRQGRLRRCLDVRRLRAARLGRQPATATRTTSTTRAIEEALNVLPGPGRTPVCGGPTNPLGAGPLVGQGTGFTADPNCVPWNIWTPNGVTPAATNVPVDPADPGQATVTEYVANGSVTGDLGKYGVKLPSADSGLQLNVGAEWRQENANFLPDLESQLGSAAGSGGPMPPVSGSFTVREAFTEMRLPLASHVAGADDLAFEGGYRYSKYSLGFNTNTYKLGLEWAPVRDIRLRGSYQRAVRAPNIGELFTPQAVGLDGRARPVHRARCPRRLAGAVRAHRRDAGPVRPHRREPGLPVQRPVQRQPEPAAGNRRHLHGGPGAAAAVRAEPDGVDRLLQHQDRQSHRPDRRRRHPQ